MAPKNVLLVKLGAVGDVVHTLYAARALRESFPDTRIGWVIEERSFDLVDGNPDIDEVILFPRRKIAPLLKSPRTFISGLNKLSDYERFIGSKGYEVAIDFQALLKSGWITRASRAKKRVGFDKWREFNKLFTNIRVDATDREHAVLKYLKLVEALGAEPPSERPTIEVPYEKRWKLDQWLADYEESGGNFGILNPSATWLNKVPDLDALTEAALRVSEKTGINWLIIWGGEAELARAHVLEDKMGRNPARIAPPTDLKELYHLLSRARIYVGTDSGPMHMAALAGVPVVALFGPSDPARVGPYDVPHRIVRVEYLDCLGCWKRKCRRPKCMEELEPKAIYDAVRELLKETDSETA